MVQTISVFIMFIFVLIMHYQFNKLLKKYDSLLKYCNVLNVRYERLLAENDLLKKKLNKE